MTLRKTLKSTTATKCTSNELAAKIFTKEFFESLDRQERIGELLIQARLSVEAGEAGEVRWADWCKSHLTMPYSEIVWSMKIASAKHPDSVYCDFLMELARACQPGSNPEIDAELREREQQRTADSDT
jgi:hypothetical protein